MRILFDIFNKYLIIIFNKYNIYSYFNASLFIKFSVANFGKFSFPIEIISSPTDNPDSCANEPPTTKMRLHYTVLDAEINLQWLDSRREKTHKSPARDVFPSSS